MPSLIGFMQDQRGAVTIEFTVIVPLFIFIFIFFCDASILYLTHTEMYNAARNIARKMAVGELATPSEVKTYATEHLFLGNRTYWVYPNFISGQDRVTIAIPMSQAVIFGAWFTPIIGKTLAATAVVGSELQLVQG